MWKISSVTTTELSQPIKLEHALQKFVPFQFSNILPTLKLHTLIEQEEPIEVKSILKSSKCKILPIMEVKEPKNASESTQPSQLELEASTTTTESDDDIDFGQADEVEDFELPAEEVEEPVQVTVPSTPLKKLSRQCKAVESSLDGQYWTVVSVRRSSRIRRKPNFYSPS